MMRDFVEIAAHAAEVAGVLVIIGGMLFAAARYAFVGTLLGLEILVAADIISTALAARRRRPRAILIPAGAATTWKRRAHR